VAKKLLSLYGLKYDPFVDGAPTEALYRTGRIEEFVWRIRHQAGDGGFALVSGEPGVGKSAALRILAAELSTMRDVTVGVLTRPQASVADFYRELGHLFAVPLAPHNRWAGAKSLREKWLAHIDHAGVRPVLILDEAQEARANVLNELRLLAAAELDAASILTVVLAGDERFTERLRTPELRPLDSRIRARLRLESASHEDLRACLHHLMAEAGAPKLMTNELVVTLVEHAGGNYRALTTMAYQLLAAAGRREKEKLDQGLFLEVFDPETPSTTKKKRRPT
jgi:type II secretory pathway predicted ATPase ExeA